MKLAGVVVGDVAVDDLKMVGVEDDSFGVVGGCCCCIDFVRS